MKFNSNRKSSQSRKDWRAWQRTKRDSENPGFLVLIERVCSHLEMMIPDREGITHGRFMWALNKYAPHADNAKMAHIVQQVIFVWTFANRLPESVKDMQYHGMCE